MIGNLNYVPNMEEAKKISKEFLLTCVEHNKERPTTFLYDEFPFPGLTLYITPVQDDEVAGGDPYMLTAMEITHPDNLYMMIEKKILFEQLETQIEEFNEGKPMLEFHYTDCDEDEYEEYTECEACDEEEGCMCNMVITGGLYFENAEIKDLSDVFEYLHSVIANLLTPALYMGAKEHKKALEDIIINLDQILNEDLA